MQKISRDFVREKTLDFLARGGTITTLPDGPGPDTVPSLSVQDLSTTMLTREQLNEYFEANGYSVYDASYNDLFDDLRGLSD